MTEGYKTFTILFLFLLLYFGTFLLVKFGKIKKINQRRFWNIVLLFTFLISGILGLIMAIIIDFGFIVPIYPKLLLYHVRFGIVMAAITFTHVFLHWRYYWLIVKKNN